MNVVASCCPQCGCSSQTGDRFCRHCGTALPRAETPAAPAHSVTTDDSTPDTLATVTDGVMYSEDPRERLRAGQNWARHNPLEAVPTEDGLPAVLRPAASTLEHGTYGAVNAWLLLIGPSPGGSPPTDPLATAQAIERDSYPAVLGRAHPHFFWPDTAGFFTKTRVWVTECFSRASVTSPEEEALSLAMIVNLLDQPAADSRALRATLHLGTSRLRAAVRVARPRLVVALTNDVLDAVLAAFPEFTVSPLEVTKVRQYNPQSFWLTNGETHFAVARSPNHPSRHHPVPETYDYLAHLVRMSATGR
jgi:hypothetical protein